MSNPTMVMSDQGLKPTGYMIAIPKFPDISFNVQGVRIPDVTLGVTYQTNSEQNIAHPGTSLQYGPLSVSFILDETLISYTKIHGWQRQLSTFEVPNADMAAMIQRFSKQIVGDRHEDTCDIVLTVLDSYNNPVVYFTFVDAFPTNVGGWTHDTTDSGHTYLKFDVQFTYTYFRIDQATDK